MHLCISRASEPIQVSQSTNHVFSLLTTYILDKDIHEKSNIADFVKESTEYHQLTAEQKAKLILDFDKVKKAARDCPSNITAHSHAAECARSFQYVREEVGDGHVFKVESLLTMKFGA